MTQARYILGWQIWGEKPLLKKNQSGWDLQNHLPLVLHSATEEVLAGLTPQERAEVIRLLEKIQKNLLGER